MIIVIYFEEKVGKLSFTKWCNPSTTCIIWLIKLRILATFRASAVQSDTGHPWSGIVKAHPPLEIWRCLRLKSPEGFSKIYRLKQHISFMFFFFFCQTWKASIIRTCESFMNSCAFLRVVPYSSTSMLDKIAWTANAASHSWLPQPCQRR